MGNIIIDEYLVMKMMINYKAKVLLVTMIMVIIYNDEHHDSCSYYCRTTTLSNPCEKFLKGKMQRNKN